MQNNENDEQQGLKIPLDGTFGMGALAELTVYTRVPETDQIKETTYTVPFGALDMRKLDAYNTMNLINGFRVIKVTEGSSLKELGL